MQQKIFSKNFVAILKIKPILTLDKPIYVRFSIADFSKLLMYEFHYKCIKRKYNSKLLFTGKGNLVYEVETDDVYGDFYRGKNLLYVSDYPQDLKFFDLVNKKVAGKMKYEFKVKIISELYSVVGVDSKENKKAKGVNKSVVRGIKHKGFVKFWFVRKLMRHRMKRTQSKLHRIATYNVCKISCFDNKRYMLDDGINSLIFFR